MMIAERSVPLRVRVYLHRSDRVKGRRRNFRTNLMKIDWAEHKNESRNQF
ncbi:hypothetical protein Hanom_Chr05g00438601 [Helianthus anomalus]